MRRAITILLVSAVVGFAIVFGIDWLTEPDGPQPVAAPEEAQSADLGDPQSTIAVVTRSDDGASAGAAQLMVLAHEAGSASGTVLLVPTATVVDVPGHGLLPLSEAYAFGEGPLLGATVENLLGVDLDGVVTFDQADWAAVFDAVGGFRVEVPEQLTRTDDDGTTSVRFQPGSQELAGDRLAELLTFREDAESELETLPRVQSVLQGLLSAVATAPEPLAAALDDVGGLAEAGVEPSALADLLGRLAAVGDGLVVRTLPVSPTGAGEEDRYRVDRERLDELVAERLAASVPERPAGGLALQVLNGNGTPGIGQEVAEVLVPAGFRVVSTGNADHFDHVETRILVYSDDPGDLRAAEQVRELLGVGRVERSGQPISVVDITIVVGEDFVLSQGLDS